MLRAKNTYFFLVSKFIVLIFVLNFVNVHSQSKHKNLIITGADQTEIYLPLLKGKNIAIVANQTSVIFKNNNTENTHLVDSLLAHRIKIKKVFAPEHGFRGQADAGEHVINSKDTKTGLPLISLYGKNKKPQKEFLKGVDFVVFDIQDVGVRFYTYISTMSYVMEACAENLIPVLILDRPNPNGHYIDGPTLEMEHTSFVGMHPIPLVYGMTIGEYAQMVNGEKWLKNGVQCDLTVIPLQNYDHDTAYHLPVRPSPNLPNDQSINLYPSLGFFEGTVINAGRGTEFQFQRYGAPFFPKTDFSYTPEPNFGSKIPKFKGELCYGVDLSKIKKLNKVNIQWVVDAYQKTPKGTNFFLEGFTIHAGTKKLQEQIETGMSPEEIHDSWLEGIEKFKDIRKKYLLYE